ncbi:hypothetical protein CF319_g2711 [Tilletia indica]|nr:hypothetical protein CF319_g2711 [Tilletia indica]
MPSNGGKRTSSSGRRQRPKGPKPEVPPEVALRRQAAARSAAGRNGTLVKDEKSKRNHRGEGSLDAQERQAIVKQAHDAGKVGPSVPSIKTHLGLCVISEEATKKALALLEMFGPPNRFFKRELREEEPGKEFVKTLEGISSSPPSNDDGDEDKKRELSGANLAKIELEQYDWRVEFQKEDVFANHHVVLRLFSAMLQLSATATQQKKEQGQEDPDQTLARSNFEEMLDIMYRAHNPSSLPSSSSQM